MDLLDLKKESVKNELGITADFGRIYSFIDFGNVNYWFEEDRQDHEGIQLKENEKLIVGLQKLKDFASLFSEDIRFYYGHDTINHGSLGLIRVAREVFGQHRVMTKPIQKVRHDLSKDEMVHNTRAVKTDKKDAFVYIPKCNFDIEICVDTMKLIESYDTLCLFSSDADFVHLARFIKSRGKKIILVKGKYILHTLRQVTDLVINAQDIKKHITNIKQI